MAAIIGITALAGSPVACGAGTTFIPVRRTPWTAGREPDGPVRASGDMEPDDAAIIAVSHADPTSFGSIFDRHYDAVWRYLTSRVGSGLADDLAAETFLSAFRSRRRFDRGATSARPWLFGIAANHVRHHQRSEVRRLRAYARVHDDGVHEDGTTDVDDRLDAVHRRGALADALSRLSTRDRDVVTLIAWADLTYEETAAALGIPVGTVRSRLHRARRQLRELLGSTGQYPDGEPLVEAP
jgi:RNA polymerase sigma-70 factor (ECF subfamily)